MSRRSDIEIGNELLELGLDETYARLFVANIIKHAPTEEYQLTHLSKMSDDVFREVLPGIMDALWAEHVPNKEIMEEFKITHEQFTCISEISGKYINRLARGDTTIKQIQAGFKGLLSKQKSDLLLEQIIKHKENCYASLVFSNTQDTFWSTNEIFRQNKEILNIMQELINLIKEQQNNQNRQ